MRRFYLSVVNTPNHILAQEGILLSFSIAKKVTADDVKKLRQKMKKPDMAVSEIQKLVRDKVVRDTQKALSKNKIPGLVVKGDGLDKERRRIMELTYFASLISKKIVDKKIDKYHSCYIVNAIINILGLNDEDFEDFHKKFGEFRQSESDEPLE